ncbi:MAG: hypothetical protein A3F84_23910 [Candidatus Handelsmanbacteria bacterium RIFCSPLOWO2_12_FULL_64_10]|uniref:FlgD/Vpr Ig-like domain-containing protein n=1 Tax=Handelsmanbacteria sp. (strain RIFCSPLOWO2_12_FULL_64_10) TaxID=1817868 RepID=A0A1F6C9Z4_HANXR|nr:MAG: hypothetical protein A3F84_23910 [Candidatus Handelsmanbacteria bacterium RIFCSPLOWO2_12_FULL_64_10]
MVLVAKGISVTDNSDPAPSLDVTVTSNEPDNGLGDGDTALDWEVKKNQDGTFDVWVRAERSGKGSGRIYTITATTRDASGNEAMSSATVTVGHDQGKRSAKVSASGLEEIPETFGIDQNSPNPFNPVTTIRYALPEGVDVQIVVYNILGQQVKALVSGKQGPGYYTATWDGRDEAGRRVASGVYLYRLQAGSFVQVRKMLMVK